MKGIKVVGKGVCSALWVEFQTFGRRTAAVPIRMLDHSHASVRGSKLIPHHALGCGPWLEIGQGADAASTLRLGLGVSRLNAQTIHWP